MVQKTPFDGALGLKIRMVALIVFLLLAAYFLFKHDRAHALWFGAYLLIGAFETIRFARRLARHPH